MEKLKTNTHAHTQRPYMHRHTTIPTDENLFQDVIQLLYLFIYLFIYLLFIYYYLLFIYYLFIIYLFIIYLFIYLFI